MTIKKLKKIINIFENSNIDKLQVKGFFGSALLEKNNVEILPNQPIISPIVPTPLKAETKTEIIDFNYLTEIKSPMVGIFYKAPSPDSKPFVEKGKKIKKGDVICIIEAMKVMNEILAEVDGEIVDVCAEDGKLVEFSQVLFRVKES